MLYGFPVMGLGGVSAAIHVTARLFGSIARLFSR